MNKMICVDPQWMGKDCTLQWVGENSGLERERR